MTEPRLSDREQAALRRRGTLPIAIAARLDDVLSYKTHPWGLAYDEMGQIHSRRHGYEKRPQWVVRRIRVDEPMDLTDGASVPFEARPEQERAYEERVRARRRLVAEIADSIIREGAPGVSLGVDFDLEREVMDELWARWRAATSDGFLVRALERA